MITTYQVMEVTDTYTYVVFMKDDGSSFGQMFHGLACADKDEFDAKMVEYMQTYDADNAARAEQKTKKFDGKAILREAQPIALPVAEVAIEAAGKL